MRRDFGTRGAAHKFQAFVLGLGEDNAGELYILTNTTGTPFGTTGVARRIGSPNGDLNCDGRVDFGDTLATNFSLNAGRARTKKRKGPDQASKVSLGWAYRIYIDGMYMGTGLTQASAREGAKRMLVIYDWTNDARKLSAIAASAKHHVI